MSTPPPTVIIINNNIPIPQAPPPRVIVAPSDVQDVKHGGPVRSLFHLVNVGLCVLMSWAAAQSMYHLKRGGASGFFLGGYLLAFAILLFTYECLRFAPESEAAEAFKLQCGWFYGHKGRGMYLIFVGFMALGLETGIARGAGWSCISWGLITCGIFFMRPAYFALERGK